MKERNPIYGSIKFQIKTIRENKIFGTKNIWYGSKKVKVSDPTKTIVDILDDPKLVGGMSVVYDVFKEYVETKYYDFKMLINYAEKMNNKTILNGIGLKRIRGRFFLQMYSSLPGQLNPLAQTGFIYKRGGKAYAPEGEKSI